MKAAGTAPHSRPPSVNRFTDRGDAGAVASACGRGADATHTRFDAAEANMEHLRGLGWIPDIPSHLDYTEDHPEVAPLLSRTRLARRISGMRGEPVEAITASLSAQADLRGYFSPVEDQGQLGSCTANAAAALLEYFERHACGHHIDASRLFLY